MVDQDETYDEVDMEVGIEKPANQKNNYNFGGFNRTLGGGGRNYGPAGPRTTAFSNMSSYSNMSNSSFFKFVDNPFGLGFLQKNKFAEQVDKVNALNFTDQSND